MRYASTAGHCALRGLNLIYGERWWAPGAGIPVETPAGERFGEFAYAIDFILDNPDRIDKIDFALVRLDDGVAASPSICYWGGPTGTYTEREPFPTPVVFRMFGNGIGFREAVPARTAVSLGTTNPYMIGPVGVAIFGDSGAPMITSDGRAAGIVSAFGGFVSLGTLLVNPSEAEAGTMYVPRTGPGLDRAQQALGLTFDLETAPLEDRATRNLEARRGT